MKWWLTTDWKTIFRPLRGDVMRCVQHPTHDGRKSVGLDADGDYPGYGGWDQIVKLVEGK